MVVNAERLNELVGKAIVDFGATFHAALVRVGDKLGLYRPWPLVDRKPLQNWLNEPGQPSAMSENGFAIKQQADTSAMTARLESSF